MKRTFLRALAITAGLAAPAAFTQSALAGSVILTLKRTSLLTNVDDAAGRYQYEAGSVSGASGVVIGSYQTTRRVTNGVGAQFNAAATQVTLFFNTSGNRTPASIVLEGGHQFNTGGFTGSVSAASPRYARLRDGDASYTISAVNTTQLLLNWNGPNLTFP